MPKDPSKPRKPKPLAPPRKGMPIYGKPETAPRPSEVLGEDNVFAAPARGQGQTNDLERVVTNARQEVFGARRVSPHYSDLGETDYPNTDYRADRGPRAKEVAARRIARGYDFPRRKPKRLGRLQRGIQGGKFSPRKGVWTGTKIERKFGKEVAVPRDPDLMSERTQAVRENISERTNTLEELKKYRRKVRKLEKEEKIRLQEQSRTKVSSRPNPYSRLGQPREFDEIEQKRTERKLQRARSRVGKLGAIGRIGRGLNVFGSVLALPEMYRQFERSRKRARREAGLGGEL